MAKKNLAELWKGLLQAGFGKRKARKILRQTIDERVAGEQGPAQDAIEVGAQDFSLSERDAQMRQLPPGRYRKLQRHYFTLRDPIEFDVKTAALGVITGIIGTAGLLWLGLKGVTRDFPSDKYADSYASFQLVSNPWNDWGLDMSDGNGYSGFLDKPIFPTDEELLQKQREKIHRELKEKYEKLAKGPLNYSTEETHPSELEALASLDAKGLDEKLNAFMGEAKEALKSGSIGGRYGRLNLEAELYHDLAQAKGTEEKETIIAEHQEAVHMYDEMLSSLREKAGRGHELSLEDYQDAFYSVLRKHGKEVFSVEGQGKMRKALSGGEKNCDASTSTIVSLIVDTGNKKKVQVNATDDHVFIKLGDQYLEATQEHGVSSNPTCDAVFAPPEIILSSALVGAGLDPGELPNEIAEIYRSQPKTNFAATHSNSQKRFPNTGLLSGITPSGGVRLEGVLNWFSGNSQYPGKEPPRMKTLLDMDTEVLRQDALIRWVHQNFRETLDAPKEYLHTKGNRTFDHARIPVLPSSGGSGIAFGALNALRPMQGRYDHIARYFYQVGSFEPAMKAVHIHGLLAGEESKQALLKEIWKKVVPKLRKKVQVENWTLENIGFAYLLENPAIDSLYIDELLSRFKTSQKEAGKIFHSGILRRSPYRRGEVLEAIVKFAGKAGEIRDECPILEAKIHQYFKDTAPSAEVISALRANFSSLHPPGPSERFGVFSSYVDFLLKNDLAQSLPIIAQRYQKMHTVHKIDVLERVGKALKEYILSHDMIPVNSCLEGIAYIGTIADNSVAPDFRLYALKGLSNANMLFYEGQPRMGNPLEEKRVPPEVIDALLHSLEGTVFEMPNSRPEYYSLSLKLAHLSENGDNQCQAICKDALARGDWEDFAKGLYLEVNAFRGNKRVIIYKAFFEKMKDEYLKTTFESKKPGVGQNASSGGFENNHEWLFWLLREAKTTDSEKAVLEFYKMHMEELEKRLFVEPANPEIRYPLGHPQFMFPTFSDYLSTLNAMFTEEFEPYLIELMAHKDNRIRIEAMKHLSNTQKPRPNTPKAWEALERLYKQPESDLKYAALAAMHRLDPDRVLRKMEKEAVQIQTPKEIEVLLKLNPGAPNTYIDYAVTWLGQDNLENFEREKLCDILEKYGRKEDIHALWTLSRNAPDDKLREYRRAVIGIIQRHPDAALKSVMDALSPETRLAR